MRLSFTGIDVTVRRAKDWNDVRDVLGPTSEPCAAGKPMRTRRPSGQCWPLQAIGPWDTIASWLATRTSTPAARETRMVLL